MECEHWSHRLLTLQFVEFIRSMRLPLPDCIALAGCKPTAAEKAALGVLEKAVQDLYLDRMIAAQGEAREWSKPTAEERWWDETKKKTRLEQIKRTGVSLE